MSTNDQRLFDLMPAFYRLKDAALAQSITPLTPAEQNLLQNLQALPPPLTPDQQRQLNSLLPRTRGPLQSLLMLIAEQLAVMDEDLDQLYDDQFIETCAPWVIPYIGDLLGYQSVNGVASAVASPRAEVAHTISFRRRKGTVLVLEQLARDVTGWGAHAVEMFKLLADTQYMNHIRPHNSYAPNLRRWEPGEFMNTGFDRTAHKVDVRRIAVERGRYNLPNIGIFLWSLNAYSLTMAPATPVQSNPQCFRFSSLGRDIPLFNDPVPQGTDITAAAEPQNVPDRLRRHVLCHDIEAPTMPEIYYGIGNSLALYLDDGFVSQIRVCDLSGDDGSWNNLPIAGDPTSIDPQLGRIAIAPPAPGSSHKVKASFYYGFNADMGGGEYPRGSSFPTPPQQPVVQVSGGDSGTLAIQAALDSLAGDGVVEIADSETYSEAGGLNIGVKAGGRIQLRAADGCRPTLNLGGKISVTGKEGSAFDLNGLVVAYVPAGPKPPPALVHVPNGGANLLSQLSLNHCTLVPGWALMAAGDPQKAYAGLPTLLAEVSGLQVTVQKSIIGGLWVNVDATAEVTDSIVDATDISEVAYAGNVDAIRGPEPGGALTLTGCTVVGKVYASLLSLVSDSIVRAALSAADLAATPALWRAPFWAGRRQDGCVRFSYLPAGSIVPRHFQCVEESSGQPQPLFYSLRYGDAAYAKLWPGTDDTIRRGAHDGGEMGAFHFVQAPQRETDLRVRMQEYLPVGLQFGVFYEN